MFFLVLIPRSSTAETRLIQGIGCIAELSAAKASQRLEVGPFPIISWGTIGWYVLAF